MGMARRFRMGTVSAGGYHHHIGYNTWQGEDAPPPPPDALGLHHISFDLPEQTEMNNLVHRIERAGIPYEQNAEGILLYDPSRNGILLRVRSVPGYGK